MSVHVSRRARGSLGLWIGESKRLHARRYSQRAVLPVAAAAFFCVKITRVLGILRAVNCSQLLLKGLWFGASLFVGNWDSLTTFGRQVFIACSARELTWVSDNSSWWVGLDQPKSNFGFGSELTGLDFFIVSLQDFRPLGHMAHIYITIYSD